MLFSVTVPNDLFSNSNIFNRTMWIVTNVHYSTSLTFSSVYMIIIALK